jgi:hypothetical protein
LTVLAQKVEILLESVSDMSHSIADLTYLAPFVLAMVTMSEHYFKNQKKSVDQVEKDDVDE